MPQRKIFRFFRGRTKPIKELGMELERKYPKEEKMPLRTRIRALRWKARNYAESIRKKPPKKLIRYEEFYDEFLRRVKEIRANKRGRSPVVIFIGGIAAVGKSTLARRIQAALKETYWTEPIRVQAISLDEYFKQRAKVKKRGLFGIREEKRIGVREVRLGVYKGGRILPGEFDDPAGTDFRRFRRDLKTLLSGGRIKTIVRDIVSGELKEKVIDGKQIDFIIVDGLFALHPSISKYADLKVGLLGTLGEQLRGRIERDLAPPEEGGRGRDIEHVAHRFVSRAKWQHEFVLPTLRNADMLFDIKEAKKAAAQTGFRALGTSAEEVWALGKEGSAGYVGFLEIVASGKIKASPEERRKIASEEPHWKRRWEEVERMIKEDPGRARALLEDKAKNDPRPKVREKCKELLKKLKKNS